MEIQLDHIFRLREYSHFFIIDKISAGLHGMLVRFSNKYATYKFSHKGVMEDREINHSYSVITTDTQEFRFHIGQLADFLETLERSGFDQGRISRSKFLPNQGTDIVIDFKPHIELRDYQIQARDFITSNDQDSNTRLVGLRTGAGKGIVALSGIVATKKRTMIVVLPMYIEKWAKEISEVTTVDPKKIMLIQGSKDLKGLIDQATAKETDVDFIIVSLITLRNYYKAYEKNRFETIESYGCAPEDLMSLLGVGMVISDESHQHLHAIYKVMVYTHVEKFVALTATLISDDHTVEAIHKFMFPKEARFENVVKHKYIHVTSFSYRFENLKYDKIKWQQWGSNAYSQVMFEQSVMSRQKVLENYFKFIDSLLHNGYFKDYIKGDKAVIFAGTIAMCTKIVEYLKEIYPKLDIRRYVEDDPFINIIEPDIRVTTIISGGTAVDIPDLRCAIMTNAIQSPVSNLQAMGRLRQLKDRDVKFYYTYCEQIPKQVQYHKKKIELFEDRAVDQKDFRYNNWL